MYALCLRYHAQWVGAKAEDQWQKQSKENPPPAYHAIIALLSL